MTTSHSVNRSIAVFIDFENLALGFKDRSGRFEVKYVLKRLLEKGKIVVKKAYCDWNRFQSYTASLHESAIELIEIPKRSQTGKNSADIRLCVDAMDLAYSKDHINTFVIVSGDSDFSPLVSKLKELGKHVVGIGMNASTSALLRDNCDEFLYYEDIVPVADAPSAVVVPAALPESRRNAFNLLFEALTALRREDKEFLGAALIKNTICRLHPGFSESQAGYRSFTALLQDAAKEGLLELALHHKTGTWIVSKFGDDMKLVESEKTERPKPASVKVEAERDVPSRTPSSKPLTSRGTTRASAVPPEKIKDGNNVTSEVKSSAAAPSKGRSGGRRPSSSSRTRKKVVTE